MQFLGQPSVPAALAVAVPAQLWPLPSAPPLRVGDRMYPSWRIPEDFCYMQRRQVLGLTPRQIGMGGRGDLAHQLAALLARQPLIQGRACVSWRATVQQD